jgi:hypothetical protein
VKKKKTKRKKIYRSRKNYFRICLFLLLVFSASFVCAQQRAKAQASLEIGGDSHERRYFRPCLRFDFPAGSGDFFIEMDYIQRINSRLRGEIDFWLSAGYIQPISKFFFVDAGIHHLCRHKTSIEYPVILDINEVFARFWFRNESVHLGLGSGSYLGTSGGYDHIMVFNMGFPNLFRSEFSGNAEIKFIDMKEILYDFELDCALSSSLDLFLRYTRHYQYPKTAYMGLRVKAGQDIEGHIDKLMFKTGIYPFHNKYKVAGSHEFKLSFLKSKKSRVLIIMQGRIPVLWGEGFIGPYRPEEINYPLSLQYEKKVGRALFAAGYFRYTISMPMDINKGFSSDLGAGLALRNQRDFDELKNRLRFEIFAGQNFSHDIDAGARAGWNSVGKVLNFGSDLEVVWNPKAWMGSAEIFFEFGSDVKIRPYIGFRRIMDSEVENSSFNRFFFGIQLMQWH